MLTEMVLPMWRGSLFVLLASCSFGAITGVAINGVTNTQAVLSYTASSSSACAVEVSESATYSPLVHDVDAALFAGANSDARASAISSGTARIFPIGARIVQTALDSNNYSRALQANTMHYYRITCGSDTATGTFTTANIPFGMTYQDLPQLDPATPGGTLKPTLLDDRTQTIIDPHTGALIQRVTLPEDIPYSVGNPSTTGPYLYDGGFDRVCGVSLVGPGPGYLCSFPQGDGGVGVLYYIIPSTGEARYLGSNNWGAAYALINPLDNKFYVLHNDVDLVAKTYTGSYTSATPGTSASFSSATILSGIPSAIHTFNSAYSATDFPCGNPAADVGVREIGDYVILSCLRGTQDTYGWLAVVQISTARVIAATRVDANIKSRWCAIHEAFSLYDQPVAEITTHNFVGGNGFGGGPYVNTYAGGSTLAIGSTTIPVSGEPGCSACGADPDVALAQVGDQFIFTDGTGDTVTILTKTSSTSWITTPTAYTHAPGAVLAGNCSFKPIFWRFTADPNGTDTTNTNYVQDQYWPIGGHDDGTTGLWITENTGWETRAGNLVSMINQPDTAIVGNSPRFAGALGQCYGNGCVSHPSAGAPLSLWLTDYLEWAGAFADAGTWTNITGQLYKYNPSAYGPATPRYLPTAGKVDSHYSGSGPHSLRDVSGPSVTLGTTSANAYQFCIANVPGECYAGSAKGDEFVNLPGSPSLSCGGGASPCLNNFAAYTGVLQIGADGSHTRVITQGLTGLGDTNDYPTAKSLADGLWALFAVGDVAFRVPSQVLMAKLPPFVAGDSVDRSKFVPISVPLTNPGGAAVSAAIQFGYLEQGSRTQYRCTSRAETCVATTSTAPPTDGVTDPFKYLTTDAPWTGVSCASSCTVIIPALPGHVVYYQPIWLDSRGSVVATGTASLSADDMRRSPSSPPRTPVRIWDKRVP
jgi:hypothetical protein